MRASTSSDINAVILLRRYGGARALIPLTVRPYVIIVPARPSARSPIRRCAKREIVQTSCLMPEAGGTWNAINLKARALARRSSVHCERTVVTIVTEASASDAALRAARNCGSSSLSVCLPLLLSPARSLSLFLSLTPLYYPCYLYAKKRITRS